VERQREGGGEGGRLRCARVGGCSGVCMSASALLCASVRLCVCASASVRLREEHRRACASVLPVPTTPAIGRHRRVHSNCPLRPPCALLLRAHCAPAPPRPSTSTPTPHLNRLPP
jgi:hypothetical protein